MLAIEPNADLAVESRAPAVELHQRREQRDHRRGEAQQCQADGDVEQAFCRGGDRAAAGKAIGENEPRGVYRVQIDAAGLTLHEAGEIIDVNAGGLDPQEVFQRQGIAPFLQRQHHLGNAEIFHITGEIMNGGAGNCLFHHLRALVHHHIADDDKAAAGLFAQGPQSLCPVARAQHQHPPPKGRGPQQGAHQQPVQHQQHRCPHQREKQGGAPEHVAA